MSSGSYRVTDNDVEKIIDVDSSLDIWAFIESANALINSLIADPLNVAFAALDDTLLTQIEKWLSAHFCACKQQQLRNEQIGDAAYGYTGLYDKNLDFTQYGQQVLILDITGTFARLGKKPSVGVVFKAL